MALRTSHIALRTAVVAAAALAAAPLAAQTGGDTLTLSLGQAVELARAGDEVRLATSQREAASAQISSARAAGLPQLRFNGGFTHVYENARGQAVGSIFNQPNTYSANFNLSVPLFQGGRVQQGLRAARSLRDAAQAEVEDTESEVSLQVLRAYLAALLADRLVAIQETNLELADARLKQVEQFEQGGRASRYEVLRARVERSNLEPALIQARGDRDLALLELRRLTNLPKDRPVRLVTQLDPAAVKTLADGMASSAADSATLESLPSVRAARLRARSERAVARAAVSGYLPTVSLNVLQGYQAFPLNARFPMEGGSLREIECPPGSQAGRVCTEQNGGWFSDRSLGLTVSWPLFDGLRARSDVSLARARATVAEIQAGQVREQAAIEAERTAAELRRAQALFDASRQNVAEAEEAFRLASLRFSRGLGTQLEVSDAQLALLTARTNEARATHELYLAAAAVARALGRPVPVAG